MSGILRHGSQGLPRRDAVADGPAGGQLHRFEAGQPPAPVGDGHDRPPRHRPGEPDGPVAGGEDLAPRGGPVHPAVPGRPGFGRRVEGPQHGRGRHRLGRCGPGHGAGTGIRDGPDRARSRENGHHRRHGNHGHDTSDGQASRRVQVPGDPGPSPRAGRAVREVPVESHAHQARARAPGSPVHGGAPGTARREPVAVEQRSEHGTGWGKMGPAVVCPRGTRS